MAHIEAASLSVCLVSAADKLHNVRAITRDYRAEGDDIWQRFKGRRDGTLWYYQSLGKIFLERLPGKLADELARAVLELTAVAGTRAGSI